VRESTATLIVEGQHDSFVKDSAIRVL